MNDQGQSRHDWTVVLRRRPADRLVRDAAGCSSVADWRGSGFEQPGSVTGRAAHLETIRQGLTLVGRK